MIEDEFEEPRGECRVCRLQEYSVRLWECEVCGLDELCEVCIYDHECEYEDGDRLEQARIVVEEKLNELSAYFLPHCKLTFIMRNPEVNDGDMIVTNDDLDVMGETIHRLKLKDK